jgi:hypothetical protein
VNDVSIGEINLLRKAVVYIFSGEISGEQLNSVQPLGTGFFVGVPHHQNTGAIWPYFVTAKHVIRDDAGYRGEIFLRLNTRNWTVQSNQQGVHYLALSIFDSQRNSRWIFHSNPDVDIATIQLRPQQDLYDTDLIPDAAFVTQDIVQRAGIVEGQELFFPCFTPEMRQIRRNNPVIRFGRIALLSTEVDETTQTRTYYAECFPFGGNSGSPVFVKLTATGGATPPTVYGLFGVMTGHLRVPQPVEIVQTNVQLWQHMGIATVVPIDYLREILCGDMARRQRGEIS